MSLSRGVIVSSHLFSWFGWAECCSKIRCHPVSCLKRPDIAIALRYIKCEQSIEKRDQIKKYTYACFVHAIGSGEQTTIGSGVHHPAEGMQ